MQFEKSSSGGNENKIFFDASPKSDACGDGQREFFLHGLILHWKSLNTASTWKIQGINAFSTHFIKKIEILWLCFTLYSIFIFCFDHVLRWSLSTTSHDANKEENIYCFIALQGKLFLHCLTLHASFVSSFACAVIYSISNFFSNQRISLPH